MDLGTLYRDIVETSLDGIWVIDAEGRTLYANRRVAELLGRTTEEVAGLTVFDVLDDTGRGQFAEHLLDLGRGQVHPTEVECLWLRSDGSGLWVLVQESALHDADGQITGFLHRITDYTERRRLFEELTSSRQLLAEAQRIAKVGSYEWDLVRDVIHPSDELYELYGVVPADFGHTYADYLDLVHPEDRHLVDATVVAAVEGVDELEFVVRVLRRDQVRWMRGRGVVSRDEHGRPVRVRGTHQDVTDAKEAELTLRDLVAQNTLMQSMAIAANEAETLIEVLQVGRDLLLAHDDWVRGRGYLPDPTEPDGLRPLYVDRDERDADGREPALVAHERALAVRSLHERAQVWDEQTRVGRPAIAFPVLLGAEVVAVIVITASTPFERHAMIRQMIDQIAVQLGRVAERERAARELAEARDAAMAASRQKSEFLATMSHEIRTPLNGVIGLNDLLLRTDLDAHQLRLATGAQVASRSLLAVINDILDFSKIEAGRLELENVDFEVRRVFDQVASLLAESARAKGLELIVACRPDVPERLTGDPTRLAQVLTNLGSNAVKFTDRGEVFVRATWETAAAEPVLRVEVADTGVGVDPETRERIFHPFSQADASTTRRYGGTGLGLPIASEIVAALGGEIGLDSVPGEGATFWFTARLAPAGTAPAGEEVRRAAAVVGKRVLVVDDNANNRLVMSEQLARWGMSATTADGAVAALEAMQEAVAAGAAFDAVLVDLAMPDYDGLHLAAMVHADDTLAGSPLVMLTSSAEPGPEELVRAGVAGCLTKPVMATDLLDTLLRVLDEQSPADLRTPSVDVTEAPTDRPRLLVVEDNPVNQLVALGILQTLGYPADTADDGAEAVERYRRGIYAAVLMDVQMPRLDGYAATRTIRDLEGDGRRVPVIAMTAAAVEGEREKCLAAGMDDFLTKPVNPDRLEAILRRLLDDDGSLATEPDACEGVLDRGRLDMLRDLDPESTAYLDRAIDNLVARSPESLHALRSAVAAGDPEALTRVAHRLKGSALNLGLPAVGHLAHELELVGDSGTTEGAADLLGDIARALSRATEEVLAYQREYRAVRARSSSRR